MKGFTGTVVIACALVCARPALSAEPAAAEALFQKGRVLMEKGDSAHACPIFAESYRLDPAPGTLLNIAACNRISGKTATAWGQFLEAERSFRRKGDERRAEFAASQAKDVEPLLAYVVLKVQSPVKGLVVKRDGVEVSETSFKERLPIDPGEHEVVAEAEGKKSVTLKLTAVARETTEWVIPDLEAAPPGAGHKGPTAIAPIRSDHTRDDAAVSHRGRTQRIAGFVVGGVGVAAAVTGAVFIGLTAARSSDLEELCPDHLCSTQEGKDALDEATLFANLANGLLISGGALVATGLVVVLTAPKDGPDASVWLAPLPGGVAIAFSF